MVTMVTVRDIFVCMGKMSIIVGKKNDDDFSPGFHISFNVIHAHNAYDFT